MVESHWLLDSQAKKNKSENLTQGLFMIGFISEEATKSGPYLNETSKP